MTLLYILLGYIASVLICILLLRWTKKHDKRWPEGTEGRGTIMVATFVPVVNLPLASIIALICLMGKIRLYDKLYGNVKTKY